METGIQERAEVEETGEEIAARDGVRDEEEGEVIQDIERRELRITGVKATG